jgi:hypothetical protein
MNTIDLIKDNTDYKNQADIYNAIVTGCGKANIPGMTTSAAKISAAFTSALTVADNFVSGMVYNNVSSTTANLAVQLPAVANNTGKYLTFFIGAAYVMRITPAAGEAIYLFGNGVVTKYLNIAAVVGNYATLYCDGVYWYVMATNGVVTKEA